MNPNGHLIGDIPDDMIREWVDHNSAVPGVDHIKTKSQWGKWSREMKRLTAAGIDPSKIKGPGVYYPEGTPLIVKLIDRIRRLFRPG